MDLSVVIPVHDEAENVERLTDEIHSALAGRSYEIVFVDDGSEDDTLGRLRELRARTPDRLRIIRHRTACGQSTAISSGVAAARGEWIATLDGDGQNDPADIPALLSERDRRLAVGEDPMLCGHRVNRRDTWLKRVSSRIANGVRSRLLRDRTPDTGCGLKLFRRALFLSFPYFDHMHRFLPALARKEGADVLSVPVNHRPRVEGRSKYGLHDRLWVGIVDLMGVRWLIRRDRRTCAPEEVPPDVG